jgi:hypothetical protein
MVLATGAFSISVQRADGNISARPVWIETESREIWKWNHQIIAYLDIMKNGFNLEESWIEMENSSDIEWNAIVAGKPWISKMISIS